MDVSREYATMCESAAEIQSQAPDKPDKEVGVSFWIAWRESRVCRSSTHAVQRTERTSKDQRCPLCGGQMEPDHEPVLMTSCPDRRDQGTVWLPRQDQLQEIYLPHWKPGHRLDMFYKWFMYEAENWHSEHSLEQLWLAFVMEKRYHKIWDGARNWIPKAAGHR